MGKGKVSKIAMYYSWEDKKKKSKLLNRAKLALIHAKAQVEFWKSEIKFWEEISKEHEYNFVIKEKSND